MNINENSGMIIGSVLNLEYLKSRENNISLAILRINPMEGGGKFTLYLTQEEFNATVKRYWWDGTKSCLERLDKKLRGKFFNPEFGID